MGPGTVLAWTYRAFLQSFCRSRRGWTMMKYFAHVTAFWLKYFDHLLVDGPAGLDAASQVAFLGRRSPERLTDRALLEQYRGAQRATKTHV